MKILNLTQHKATPEQITAGVIEPAEEDKQMIQKLLTFKDLPTPEEIYEKVKPLYAFSKREVVEEQLPDGSVRKTQVFKHLGFVEV